MDSVMGRGLQFLKENQMDDGEWPMYLCLDSLMRGEHILDSTVFATAVTCAALLRVPGGESLVAKGAGFLKQNQLSGGFWRYWTPKSGKTIAPDLDDTSVVSKVLHHLGNDYQGSQTAAILANQNPDGLFKTWLKKEENDVDSVVNANVIWRLGETPATLSAGRALCRILESDDLENSYWYYLHPCALYHAVARASDSFPMFRKLGPIITQHIRQVQISDPFNAALAVSSLNLLKTKDHALMKTLENQIREAQEPDGSWPMVPYYTGPEPPGPRAVWFGSQAVVTAHCLEALALTRPSI